MADQLTSAQISELERFLSALRNARYAHPSLRLGQLLSNAVGTQLFYLSDQGLIEKVTTYSQLDDLGKLNP